MEPTAVSGEASAELAPQPVLPSLHVGTAADKVGSGLLSGVSFYHCGPNVRI